MRKILSSRIFRILVCLALICCFLVDFSPIKAEAVVTEGLITGSALVPVVTAAAAILIALGVMAATDPAPFQQVVNDFATWLTNSTSYVVNGMVNVLGIMYADGTVKSFVLKDMIQDGWKWVFDSGIVTHSLSSIPSEFHDYYQAALDNFCSIYGHYPPYICYAESGEFYAFGFSEYPFFAESNTYYKFYKSYLGSQEQSFNYYYVYRDNWVHKGLTKTLNYTGNHGFFALEKSVYSTNDGLTLGQIQAPITGTDEEIIDIEVAPIYVDWISGKVSATPPDTGEDKKEYCPVGFPSTDLDDLLLSQSQQQAQSGENDLDFDFETSTDPDPGTGTDPGTDSGSGSGSWSPPNDMGKFTLDLKDYFPFCIPFDMYDFFTCLNADPVAPVIEWIIPMPGGASYPLELDLSVFDSVAQLLRRMELLAFCVGLAFKTRDLIKG